MRQVYAGVMSGTSLDGIDAVVADFAPADAAACRGPNWVEWSAAQAP